MNKVDGISEQELWHRRLGHPSRKVLSIFPKVRSRIDSSDANAPCDICFRAKQTREIFAQSENKASTTFSLIHCDVWGPYRVPALCGAYYFLIIVDDFSRAVWTYLLVEKREVSDTIKKFCVMVERQFQARVQTVRSDNGSKFKCLRSYFSAEGILHQSASIGTPQQNGRVERKHRHILNMARDLHFQAGLPIEFWGECILTANFLINRTPSVLLDGKTPYEILVRKPPNYNYFRIFGFLCYARSVLRDKDKFGAQSRRCVFVGYSFVPKGWSVYYIDTGEYFVSCDVVFTEMEFPYAVSSTSQSEIPVTIPAAAVDDGDVYAEESSTLADRGSVDLVESGTPSPEPELDVVNNEPVIDEQLGRGHRQTKKSILLNAL